jgi:uncharacterized protein (TIGR03000 family)
MPMKPTAFFVFATLLAVPELTAFERTPASAVDQATTSAQVTSRFSVTLPNDETELFVEGAVIQGTGTARTFQTNRLERGRTYRYTLIATWQPNTYTKMTRRKVVSFRAGDRVDVDLTVDDPNDRVKVIYVPTPEHVVDAMMDLAGIKSDDIVFEPGCGDARITIAAVKKGARKGVGIDIDEERVADSRVRVKEAGLDDRIEIRLGDALDIKDLSSASVVFLYMGDHFDMLIRPILWRELKVGSRVVSHRFLMGDWKPDQTVTVDSGYEIHLWTITEELKRKVVAQ